MYMCVCVCVQWAASALIWYMLWGWYLAHETFPFITNALECTAGTGKWGASRDNARDRVRCSANNCRTPGPSRNVSACSLAPRAQCWKTSYSYCQWKERVGLHLEGMVVVPQGPAPTCGTTGMAPKNFIVMKRYETVMCCLCKVEKQLRHLQICQLYQFCKYMYKFGHCFRLINAQSKLAGMNCSLAWQSTQDWC